MRASVYFSVVRAPTRPCVRCFGGKAPEAFYRKTAIRRGVREESDMSGSSSSSAPGGCTDYTPPRKMGRMLAVLIVLLVATNAVTAVTVYDVTAPTATVQTLRVIGPWAGPEKAKFLPVLNLFHNQTGINYEYITTRQEDLQSLLPNWFAAGRAPADLIFMPSSFVKQYGVQGHAADLASTITQSNYAAGALDPLKDGSKLYGGAYTGKVKPGFWYNKSFFTANNLQAPTTFTGFEALLADIESRGLVTNQPIISGDGVGWPLSDVVEHFIATYGGPSMHRALTAGTLSWTDPTVRNIFATYLVPTLTKRDVCVNGCWSAPRQWDTGVTEWWAGDYALYFMGSWITGMVPNPADIGVFSLPGGVSTQGIVFAADYFFVPKYATQLDSAKRLAAFLGSAAAQTEQVKVGGHIATVTGVPSSAYPPLDASIAALLTGKEVLSDLDDTKGGTFQTTFWAQLQALWADPSTLDTVLANIQAAA